MGLAFDHLGQLVSWKGTRAAPIAVEVDVSAYTSTLYPRGQTPPGKCTQCTLCERRRKGPEKDQAPNSAPPVTTRKS